MKIKVKIIFFIFGILVVFGLTYVQNNIVTNTNVPLVIEPDYCSRDCHSFYEEMPITDYEDVYDMPQTCYYVYYTIGYDSKTDETLDDLHNLSLNEPDCTFYKVEMNEIENQQYINNQDNSDFSSFETYEDITISKFPTLIKFENNVITEVK